MLLNQVTALENQKTALDAEILGLRNSIYTNNEIIRKQNVQLRITRQKTESITSHASKGWQRPKLS